MIESNYSFINQYLHSLHLFSLNINIPTVKVQGMFDMCIATYLFGTLVIAAMSSRVQRRQRSRRQQHSSGSRNGRRSSWVKLCNFASSHNEQIPKQYPKRNPKRSPKAGSNKHRVYMGGRVSGRAPNSAPTADKEMGKVWLSWCFPGLLPGVRYRQRTFCT